MPDKMKTIYLDVLDAGCGIREIASSLWASDYGAMRIEVYKGCMLGPIYHLDDE